MDDIHDFDNTVVAVLSDEATVDEVSAALSAAGYEVEILKGDEGKAHLDAVGQTGAVATIKRLVDAFGDRFRVAEKLERELEKGNVVISVDAKPDEAEEAVNVLREHGADFIWKLGSWTFTRVGE
ncbi:MAG TPA: hypothetical protein VFO17_03250 [Acidimicrobiia bacterium]|nr:hypothetical protein [Acidimicrobiia bacterium]